MKIPKTPFSTHLSGSAKETELRLRNIFQWKKKRPPVMLALLVAVMMLSCFGLFSCASTEPRNTPVVENTLSKDDPVKETPTPSDSNDPSAVLAAMASIRAESFTNPDPNFLGRCVTTEQLAAALNAAIANQISEEEFLSHGCDSTQIFPHWYIEYAFLEGDPNDFNSKDRHLSIRCGLPENIVEVTLSEDNHRDTAYFEDMTLYWLIRQKDAFEDRMTARDFEAYARFEPLLIEQMERTLAANSANPGNFNGYELKLFLRTWTYEDERDDGQVELYNFSFGLLTDTPETVGWAGGMALDSHLRVVNVGEPKYFAVKYKNGQVVSTAFLGIDHEIEKNDRGKEHVNGALDQAKTAQSAGQSLPLDVQNSVIAVRSVLEGLTWDNTEKLTREDGEIIYEMPRNGEFFELLRLASDNLHPIDRPDEFATLPGGVFLELSDGSNGHISFFAGKNHPDVLARYVTNTVNESAIVEDFALYIFLLASSEHKYLELHDLDDDMTCETVVWISENNKRNIVIYDFYSGEPQRISVNEALGCAAAEYTGQIANIKSEYSNLIRANTADGSLLYRYSDGQFYYVCTLDEALRS